MTAKIKFTLDDDEVQRKLAEERKLVEANEKSIKGVVDATLKLEKTQLRQAKNVLRNQRSQKQILRERIKALRTLGQTDAESAKMARDGIRKLVATERERLANLAEVKRTSTDAYKAEQAEIKKGVAESKRLVAATQSLADKHRELRAALKAAFDSGKIGAKDYKQSLHALDAEQKNVRDGNPFGSKALASVASYAAGVLSVTSAVSAVRRAYQEFREEQKKGRDQTVSLRESRTSLLQVSDETNFQSRSQRVDEAAVKYATERSKVGQVLFDAISNEVEKDFETILRADRVIPANIGSKLVGEFRKVFAKENLTANQALNLGLAASGTSKFNVQEIQPQIRTAAQGSALLPGVKAADVASFVSVLGAQFGDRTGTYVRTLQANLGAELINQRNALGEAKTPQDRAAVQKNIDTLSQSLPQIVQSLSTADNKELREKITGGNKEVLTAFTVATQRLGNINKVNRTIVSETRKAGTDDSLISRRLNAYFSVDRSAADFKATSDRIAREIAAENAYSTGESRRASARDRVEAEATKGGAGPLGRFAVNRLVGAVEVAKDFDVSGLGAAAANTFAGGGVGSAFQILTNEQRQTGQQTATMVAEVKKQTGAIQQQSKSTAATTRALESLARRPVTEAIE
ncbi:hypothetical protein [Mariniblastus fucicola]|uniref:Uncharacterized protein n=1 Tax=Mariniblastus fucicola TaxID=980251 RepID=A0A5B9PNR9_9BACT|nr:hypothetical protein [Mariniblastus fucicola]QEG23893.1 hypothetical protein MFFC18_37970 [Mariniblastus fucicola]